MLIRTRVSILFMSTILAFGLFISCSDDDDDEGNSTSIGKAQFAFQTNFPGLQEGIQGVDVYEVKCQELREEGAKTSYRIKGALFIKSSESIMAELSFGYLSSDINCTKPIIFGANIKSYRVDGTINLTDVPGQTADKYYMDYLASYWGGNSAYREEIKMFLPNDLAKDKAELENFLNEFASGEIHSLNISEIENDSKLTQLEKDIKLKDYYIIGIENNVLYTNYVSEFFISNQINIPDTPDIPQAYDDDDEDDVNNSDAIAGLHLFEEGETLENTGRGYSVKWPTVLDRRIAYYKK